MKPTVSVVVPCYNEVRTIGGLLTAILHQSHPLDDIEVIVADGGSIDGTLDVVAGFADQHPEFDLQLVGNPQRSIPAGLNAAIQRSAGAIVIRLDAHSKPVRDYIDRCLAVLGETDAACVGGIWEIQPSRQNWIGRSIAAAAGHILGAGDARYRTGGAEGEVDTVPFGAFRREWLEKVGPFNERLLTNEDYEYNARIRQAGGVVWFDPAIQSVYFARGTLWELVRQYARYGFWKTRMLRTYPGTLRWRQALPPLFVMASLGLAVAAPFSRSARSLLLLVWAAYLTTLAVAGAVSATRRQDVGMLVGVPLALIAMHVAWGSGAVWGALTSIGRGAEDAMIPGPR